MYPPPGGAVHVISSTADEHHLRRQQHLQAVNLPVVGTACVATQLDFALGFDTGELRMF